MRLDTALKEFTEKYDREAIHSIDTLSKDFGLNQNYVKIELYNIKESFDLFTKYLQGYVKYKTENKNNPQASSQDEIATKSTAFIEKEIMKSKDSLYKEISPMLESYLSGINDLIPVVEACQSTLQENDVDNASIGYVSELADAFIESVDAKMEPLMEKLLWASGYNSRKKLFGKKETTTKHTFL